MSLMLNVVSISNLPCLYTGLAVFPTWLVVRDHVPIDRDAKATSDNESSHAEEGLASPTVLGLDEKEKFAVAKTSVGGGAML